MEKNSLKNSYDNFLSKVIVGIGEVSEMTKIPVRKLRYWEEKGIINTVDPQSKSRQFDLANIKKIILIQELIDDGYSLDGAAKKIEERISKIGSLMSLIEI
ncbi:MerR family transcriptional regulator [Gilliamella sp. B2772]|uniref:MerR family transcriptional regulator n=1 Tax=Gilliamella sp. B2772 TaxID=2817981 RepID=UPI00226A0B9B|nr:MerR family transcriptional regulator [Gilliamella sp. B2772]MCX8660112.1 MerR family transcriptional regulator [Gilliamella sp. B2772]